MHSLWLITVVVLSLEGCFSVATGQPLREEPELDQSKIEQASSSSVENKSAEEDSESPFFEPALHPVFASVLEKLHASLASLRDRTASVISNLEEKEGNSDESVVNPEHIVSEESPKCDGLISCMRVHVIRVPMIRNFLTSMNSLSNDQSANSGSDNMTTNPQPPSPSDLPAAPLLRITIHRSFITDNNDSSRIEPLMRFSDAFQSPPLDSIPPPLPSSHVMCNEAADCGIPMLSAGPSSSSNVYPEPEWGPHAHYRKHPRRRHSHHGPHPRYPPLVLIGLGAAGMSLMIGLVAIFVRCFSATTDTRHPYESLNTVVVRRKTVPI